MIVQQIVGQLAKGEGDKEALISQLHGAVASLCKTSTGDGTDQTTSLWDWLHEGDYLGNETAENIAAEWDNLGE